MVVGGFRSFHVLVLTAVCEREIDMPNASRSSGERSRLSPDLQKFTSLD